MTELEKRLFSGQQGDPGSRDLGLYVHVPFCRQRCHFCSFYVTPYHEQRAENFVKALVNEITYYARRGYFHCFPVSTVYFGGGTPTLLRDKQLIEILHVIAEEFPLNPKVEITIEADPSTVTETNLQSVFLMGVNRISFGMQSFEEEEWSQLGRSGGMNALSHAIELAKCIGFSNVNVDLMYGLPKQTSKSWLQSLKKTVEFRPQHVSCYALTLEEGTKFYRDVQRGELETFDQEFETLMQEDAISYLAEKGYRQYEVSNFSLPGMECQHNLRYWSGKDYLGIGPSAQSYVRGMRFGNVSEIGAYEKLLNRGELPLESLDALSSEEQARERVIFGLRLNRGISVDAVAQIDNDGKSQYAVKRMIDTGLLTLECNYLKTTATGRRHLDSIAVQLV